MATIARFFESPRWGQRHSRAHLPRGAERKRKFEEHGVFAPIRGMSRSPLNANFSETTALQASGHELHLPAAAPELHDENPHRPCDSPRHLRLLDLTRAAARDEALTVTDVLTALAA